MMLGAGVAAMVLALNAHAQNPQASRSGAPATEVPVSPPRYSASQLEQAFNYMDRNHDGKVSREEASGFRGVAKNFDRADTNHDDALSREEFDRAMNYVKP